MPQTAEQLEQILTTRQGPLLKILPEFRPESLQHADEIMRARRTHPDEKVRAELRNQFFWTTDSFPYRVEDENGDAITGEAALTEGEVILYATRGFNNNLIFRNITEAVKQLTGPQKNYVPKEDEVRVVLEAKNTLRFVMTGDSRLRLQKYDDEFSYLEFSTTPDSSGIYHNTIDDTPLSNRERALVQIPYGSMITKNDEKGNAYSEFELNMKMLREDEREIEATRAWVLTPDYVREKIANDKEKRTTVARAGWLYGFSSDSYFGAVDGDLDAHGGRLRGVLLESAAGGAPDKDRDQPQIPQVDYRTALDLVLKSPKKLDDAMASELLTLVAEHYQKR